MKKKVFLVLKIIFSVSVIYYIIAYRAPLIKIYELIKRANLFLLILAFSLHAIGIYISAVRWGIIIKKQENSSYPGVFNLVKFYLVAGFFNLFLPTRFGGDISRVIDSKTSVESYTKSFSVILVERINGTFILFLFSFLSSLYYILLGRESYIYKIGFLFGGVGIIGTVLFFSPLLGKFLSLLKFFPERIFSKLNLIEEAVKVIRKDKKILLEITLLSLILQINVILHYFLIGLALNIKISFISYFVFIPIVLIILIIPISINGIGLRDISLVEAFKSFGISASAAVAFSTIDLLFMILLGIIGGLIFALRKKE